MADISQRHYSMIEHGPRNARTQIAKKIDGLLGLIEHVSSKKKTPRSSGAGSYDEYMK